MTMFFKVAFSDVKRRLRSKIDLIMILVFPLVMIFILSNAFSKIMDKEFTLEPFTVGYSIHEDNLLARELPSIRDELSGSGITLLEIDETQGRAMVADGAIAGYVNFGANDTKYIKSPTLTVSADVFEGILQQIVYETGTYVAGYRYAHARGMTELPQATQETLPARQLDVEPMPTSTQYYGVAMIVNNIVFVIVGAPMLISEDRKRRANIRMALSGANPFAIFFSRVFSMMAFGVLSTAVVMIGAKLLLNIDFGSQWATLAAVIMGFTVLAYTFGVMVGYAIKNMALAQTIVFLFGFLCNFMAGCYQPYMYANDSLLRLMEYTPVYYILRAAVELSTKGESAYLGTAAAIIGIGTVACTALGLLFYRKTEGKYA